MQKITENYKADWSDKERKRRWKAPELVCRRVNRERVMFSGRRIVGDRNVGSMIEIPLEF